MAIAIPASLVEYILLGPLDDRRQLQDSPILGDVWIRYGERPSAALDLLVAPFARISAGKVAREINRSLNASGEVSAESADHQVSYLQGFVAAKVNFSELLRFIVPRTTWWLKNRYAYDDPDRPRPTGQSPPSSPIRKLPGLRSLVQLLSMRKGQLADAIGEVIHLARDWRMQLASEAQSVSGEPRRESNQLRLQEMAPLQRFVALAAIILWAGENNAPKKPRQDPIDVVLDKLKTRTQHERLAQLIIELNINSLPTVDEPDVWNVSLNRSAMPALSHSVAAVKADAAKKLFSVNCSEITWAVIDSGIDGSHPAFFDPAQATRVQKSFDFQNFRKIVSLSNLVPALRATNVQFLSAQQAHLVNPPADFDADLLKLAQDADQDRPIHWELVRRFVEIKPTTPPPTNHGTHVAGILGANKQAAEHAGSFGAEMADGMCPDISLYDFRVLAPDIKDTEFAILAVLQFIRFLNDQDNFFTIHGANMSLSIPHDVRNYACGRTPICVECERLIESGVVVVAAAGNHGYKTFQTKDGVFDSYAAFSITDPGNADQVLTVGSTHRFWPHTYGVSFFSSRGPTGDGRIKPDIVAPGERIRAPFPNNDWGDLDGTSMAAPHVSGAAAMLMARYPELVGRPRRIKQILCESATDLQRERTFQGHGMLDVLRAFQSI